MAAGFGNFPALYFDFRGLGMSPEVYLRRGDTSTSGQASAPAPSVPADNSQQQDNRPPNTGEAPEGVLYPIAPEAPPFLPVAFKPIPGINVPFVSSIDTTKNVGAFNIEQWKNALTLGSQAARDITQIDFDTLNQFFPQASALQARGVRQENAINRGEIIPSNAFNLEEIRKANIENQRQRLTQLEAALPGARDILMQQLERGSTMAGGRLVNDAEDRAFDVAARNAAAEGANIRGFGDDSVIGRKTSDLLSAQQRLDIQQAGENTLSRFLQLGANLAFDQPIKYNPILNEPLTVRTSQDIRGVPSVSGAQLATQQQAAIAQLSTIAPAQAIQFDIGQNQFQAGLDRDADKFNSTLDLQAQQFNSSGFFQAALEQFYADVFNAQQAASAFNVGHAIDNAQDAFSGSALLGGFSNTFGLGAGLLNSLGVFRGSAGGAAGGAGVAGGATGAGAAGGAAGAAEITGATEGAGLITEGSLAAVPETVNGVPVVGSAVVDGTPGYMLADGSTISASSLPTAQVTYGSTPAVFEAANAGFGGGVPAAPEIVQAGYVDGGTGGALSQLGNAASTAAAVWGAYTAYQNLSDNKKDGRSGALSGAAIGAYFGGPIGAVIGGLIGYAAGSLIGGDKGKDQLRRDSYREYGADIGLFFKPSEEQVEQLGLDGTSYYTQLADGSYYNVGTDGGAKLQNYGLNVDGKTERATFEIDWSDPRVNESVSLLNPVGLMVFGEEYQNMMGHLWNAAASNTDSLSGMKQNIQKFANDSGLDYETGIKLLNQYKDSGKLNDSDFAIYMNSWNELMLQNGVTHDVKV